MITEQHQDRASLYALGALAEPEQRAFEAELRGNAELRDLVRGFQRAADALALAAPPAELPRELKTRVLDRIGTASSPHATHSRRPAPELVAGLRFLTGAEMTGWKELPVKGAFIKLLSLERERGYAVLLGKLDPGTRYPAHVNVGPEDFFVLTGDLHIGETELRAGDFHHAEAGSHHAENFSVGGCTLLAVLTTDDPLVGYAMA